MVDDHAERAGLRPSALPASGRQRRLTIGFLTGNIHTGASRRLWPGVVDAAAAAGVNLICFPGGELRSPQGFEAQRNAVYDLAGAECLDGLINWSSAVGGALPPAEVFAFHRRFAALPLVSLTLPMPGTPLVTIDSYQGMRDLIAHLVEHHGYRRLAFIRGPESHYYAEERHRAYTDALQAYGLPLAVARVTHPLHWQGGGVEAVRLLLDERGLRPGVDFEALVAVSDLLALGAIEALQGRGLRVPADLAVAGFNDSGEGRLTTPTLTSVSLPFYEQGRRSVETLLAQIAHGTFGLPDRTVLASSLVVRQSCGCPSRTVAAAAVGPTLRHPVTSSPRFASPIDLVTLSPSPAKAVARAIDGTERLAARALEILQAFAAELAGAAPGAFLRALEDAIRELPGTDDVAAWHGAISALRQELWPYLDAGAAARGADLCEQARVVISEMAQRAQAGRQLQAERQAEALREIGQALITTFDVEKLAEVLAQRLPQIGIAGCYLALYEPPDDAGAAPSGWSRLVLAYTDGLRAALEPAGRRFRSRLLVPEGLLPATRPYSLIVEPLHFRQEQIGFIVCEIGPRDGTVYEVLRGHISSALKGALLFHEVQAARLAAEKADRLKTRLLANVSHELRTPLNIILSHTRAALTSPAADGSPALREAMQRIQHSAEHQLRVINDLLDLSRAEIDELDLYPEILDPRPLLIDTFDSMAEHGAVAWRLELPARLPALHADPVRLRQVLLNLLSNARKFTRAGEILLGAEVVPPHLHLWVSDTGIGISADQHEHIFEPFVTGEHDEEHMVGIGLGLSITRRLVALHGGTIALDSRPDRGSSFHVYLPLPSLADQPAPGAAAPQPVLLLISAADRLPTEIAEFSQRQGLQVRRLQAGADLDAALSALRPAALAWDLAAAGPADWPLVRRLRNHPRLGNVPFVLYGPGGLQVDQVAPGITSFLLKPSSSEALLAAISAACPPLSDLQILIVDDDEHTRQAYYQTLAAALPGCALRLACDGLAALAAMAAETPSLVLLDLMMPGVDGFDVLDRMRSDPRTHGVPVVILSSRSLSDADVRRLAAHAQVTFQSKGLLSEDEVVAAVQRAVFGNDALPPQTSTLVKSAIAYLHQNYARPVARWEMAQAVGTSEDYLTHIFRREIGLSPWDFLNRYRVSQAKTLLRQTNASISQVAAQVGLKDQAYFSRVFRKLAGVAPNIYRRQRDT